MGTWYHGTTPENWELIKTEGVLWGIGNSYRYTYLTPDLEIAKKYGSVVLEVEYQPKGVGSGVDNYGFDPPPGEYCWQFSVFVPIPLKRVRKV